MNTPSHSKQLKIQNYSFFLCSNKFQQTLSLKSWNGQTLFERTFKWTLALGPQRLQSKVRVMHVLRLLLLLLLLTVPDPSGYYYCSIFYFTYIETFGTLLGFVGLVWRICILLDHIYRLYTVFRISHSQPLGQV